MGVYFNPKLLQSFPKASAIVSNPSTRQEVKAKCEWKPFFFFFKWWKPRAHFLLHENQALSLIFHVSTLLVHCTLSWHPAEGFSWRMEQVCLFMTGSGCVPWRPTGTAGIISGKWMWKDFSQDSPTAAWFMAGDVTNSLPCYRQGYKHFHGHSSSLFQL